MLKKLREQKGLSQREVSEISGVNLRSLQDYEQGHKSIVSAKGETLYRLSYALDCTMEDIVATELMLERSQKDSYHITQYFQAYVSAVEKYLPWQSDIKALESMRIGKIYYLMHQNDIVTTLVFDEISGNIMHVGKEMNQELLPPGANLSIADLKKWWIRRAVPINQGQMKNLMQNNGISTTQSYLLLNLGMSLSDHYWVNPVEKCYKWEDVNLFTNDFHDEMGNYCFRDGLSDRNKVVDLKNRTVFYPSASLQGELQKKWIVQNKKRYLIKGNYGKSAWQSINEVVASHIHKKQGRFPFVNYELCDIDVSGNVSIGCLCEDFCTEKVEFIPAYDVVNSVKKRNDVSVYEHFISVCALKGLDSEYVRQFLEYQILCDFVITNTDRHLYNFGVLRDAKSLKFIGMAPIFDSGNSMFWNLKKIPKGKAILDISVNSFLTKEVDLLRYVKHPAILDLNKLPKEEELKELLELDRENISEISDIIDGYKMKIWLLEKFQNNEEIYKYGYEI